MASHLQLAFLNCTGLESSKSIPLFSDMMSRMAVSRCCCEVAVTTFTLLNANWSNYENGLTGNVGLSILGIGQPEILVQFTDFADFGPVVKQSDAFAAVFLVTTVPQGLAAAVGTFLGRGALFIGAPPDPDQTIRIYATRYNGNSYLVSGLTLHEDWSQPSADPWGMYPPGTERTTVDLATIINAVTSDAGWDQLTDQLLLIFRVVNLDHVSRSRAIRIETGTLGFTLNAS